MSLIEFCEFCGVRLCSWCRGEGHGGQCECQHKPKCMLMVELARDYYVEVPDKPKCALLGAHIVSGIQDKILDGMVELSNNAIKMSWHGEVPDGLDPETKEEIDNHLLLNAHLGAVGGE